MSDVVDQANELVERALEFQLRAARRTIPAGKPGECDSCGELMPRLVGGRCAFCRDGRRR